MSSRVLVALLLSAQGMIAAGVHLIWGAGPALLAAGCLLLTLTLATIKGMRGGS